ncbi:MAG TPA: hypothetical protein VFG14_08600 [Chthoniobacteraceae bacterium]|nr:hypothetical protein [Chthoniobacteraceae bacterium]
MNLRWHYLLVALLALLISITFLRGPGFGDDLTYWTQAFDTHEHGAKSIEKHSFHDLRWPVWGISWVIQGMVGYGMASFHGVPLFYLTLGALVAFTFGRLLLQSTAAGWAGAIGFVFHPLLDAVCFRPMPDLSEGILAGTAMLAWWASMNSKQTGRSGLWAIVAGLFVFIAEANRVTGAFIVPVLIVCTLAFFPRRFGWLLVSGVVAAGCYAGEMVIYHSLFGDWLHHINANMNNAENKGTEPMPLWILPIRFLDTLWEGNLLARPYCILAVMGIPLAWKRWGTLGRVVVIWFAMLFLEYSCMPQPVWPIRPLVRDADRFIAALAIPFSLLSVVGLWWVIEKVKARWNVRISAPAFGVIAVLLMWALTSRERFERGFVPEFHDYLAKVKPGTRVFTHEGMRAIAFLCNADAAKQISFFAPPKILFRGKGRENRVAQCEEFWYARKLVWLGERKQLESKTLEHLPALGSYFDTPERDWTLVRLLAKGDSPDLIFFKRRTPSTPPPTILASTAPELAEVMPALPGEWVRGSSEKIIRKKWSVPESLRGKIVWVDVVAGSEQVEAFTLRLKFRRGETDVAEFLLKPYLHPGGGKDFFAFPIPSDADHCDLTMKVVDKAKKIRFESFRALIFDPSASGS